MGFVYVATNSIIPGRVKIGHTTRADAALRVSEFGVKLPGETRIAYQVEVVDSAQVEKRAHRKLSRFRDNGEWFHATVANARRAILDAIEDDAAEIAFVQQKARDAQQRSFELAEAEKQRLEMAQRAHEQRQEAKRREDNERNAREARIAAWRQSRAGMETKASAHRRSAFFIALITTVFPGCFLVAIVVRVFAGRYFSGEDVFLSFGAVFFALWWIIYTGMTPTEAEPPPHIVNPPQNGARNDAR